MRYLEITHVDMKNGVGLRTILWVSGCEHKCVNCQNAYSWDCSIGKPFDDWAEMELFEAASVPEIRGITFSGGDPLHPNNREKIGELARKFKNLYPQKDIWLYTGYTLQDVKNGVFADRNGHTISIDWLQLIDVLVDGPYMDQVRKDDLANRRDPDWCGSSNQRVIDVQASITNNTIELLGRSMFYE